MHVDNAPKIYHISKRNKLVACLRKTCTGENLFFPFFSLVVQRNDGVQPATSELQRAREMLQRRRNIRNK